MEVPVPPLLLQLQQPWRWKESDGRMQMKARAPTQESRVSPRKTETTVIFVGHARLPQSLAPRDSSSVVSVELEAEVASGTILGTSVKGVLPLGTRLLDEVLAGRRIGDGPHEAVEEIRQRYVCPSQKALCTAVANAYEAYYRYRQQGLTPS